MQHGRDFAPNLRAGPATHRWTGTWRFSGRAGRRGGRSAGRRVFRMSSRDRCAVRWRKIPRRRTSHPPHARRVQRSRDAAGCRGSRRPCPRRPRRAPRSSVRGLDGLPLFLPGPPEQDFAGGGIRVGDGKRALGAMDFHARQMMSPHVEAHDDGRDRAVLKIDGAGEMSRRLDLDLRPRERLAVIVRSGKVVATAPQTRRIGPIKFTSAVR